MLIKATATFKVDDLGEDGFEVEVGSYADLRAEVANEAISQGTAVKATLAEVRTEAAMKTAIPAADEATMETAIPAADEAIKRSKKLKHFNDAEPAKE